MPARRHLPGDDAAHVVLKRDIVHDRQPIAAAANEEGAVIVNAAERERSCGRLEANRRPQRERAAGEVDPNRAPKAVDASRECERAATRVRDANWRARANREPAIGVTQQDAYPNPLRHRREVGGRVVVLQDLAVATAMSSEATCAVLAHADAVAPTAAMDHERGRRTGERERCRRERDCEERRDEGRARQQARTAAARQETSPDVSRCSAAPPSRCHPAAASFRYDDSSAASRRASDVPRRNSHALTLSHRAPVSRRRQPERVTLLVRYRENGYRVR